MNRLPLSSTASQAHAALAPPGRTLDDPELTAKDGPGLYAIYGSADVWGNWGWVPLPMTGRSTSAKRKRA